MSEFQKVGRLADFKEGRGKAVRLDGRRVAIFRLGNRLSALQDACPHMGASLSDGRLEGNRVVCHWHGWGFDLTTGESDRSKCARTYEVRVEGEDVYVRAPAEQPHEPGAGDDDWVAWDDSFLKGKD